jgi:hypothetical protein
MTVAVSNRRRPPHAGPGRPTPAVPHLRLVPSLPASPANERSRIAVPEGGAEALAMPALRGRGAAPVRHPVRLTRRGRIVLWLLLLGAAVTVAALLGPASQAASSPGPTRSVTVHRGDTMWSIATTMLPHESPGVAAERIRALNHLSDDELYAGEQLLIPAA